jgi:hypothetical protein
MFFIMMRAVVSVVQDCFLYVRRLSCLYRRYVFRSMRQDVNSMGWNLDSTGWNVYSIQWNGRFIGKGGKLCFIGVGVISAKTFL